MSSEQQAAELLFAVVNDRPLPHRNENPLMICGEYGAPAWNAIYRDRDKAIEQRDTLREAYENQDINVYKLTVEPVEDPHGGEAS